MIIGVDEAGRGPVIGPMVIVAYSTNLKNLEKIGVKDSKELSKKKRENLSKKLKEIGKYSVVIIYPEELNKLMEQKNLNEIEIEAFAKAVSKLLENNEDATVYIDACSTNIKKFKEEFLKKLNKNIKIVAEHKADSKYPIVSAASILAKVIRDEIIENYKKEYGDFGSGYPSDAKTIKFLEDYYQRYKKLPPIVRKKWKTVEKIINKQKTLDNFI